MAIIASLPHRGTIVVNEDGSLKESLAEFFSDLYQSNNNDNPKNNFRATGAPAVTNNRDEGYTIGSEWINHPTVYRLTDFTGTDATWTALN